MELFTRHRGAIYGAFKRAKEQVAERLLVAAARADALTIALEEMGPSSPEQFEARYGLHGFSEHYQYPGAISAFHFLLMSFLDFKAPFSLRNGRVRVGASARRRWLEKNDAHILTHLNAVNDELARLNPQLGTVRRERENYRSEIHFLLGTGFRFPPRDIDFFINVQDRLPSHDSRKALAFAAARMAVARLDEVTNQTRGHYHVGWCPSPETVALMHSAADRLARQAQHPQQPKARIAQPGSSCPNF